MSASRSTPMETVLPRMIRDDSFVFVPGAEDTRRGNVSSLNALQLCAVKYPSSSIVLRVSCVFMVLSGLVLRVVLSCLLLSSLLFSCLCLVLSRFVQASIVLSCLVLSYLVLSRLV